jgi:hypothetical protein
MMTLASIESAGTLLGIGVLYPIYQWSINEGIPFLVGGVPYYICGVRIYTSSLCNLPAESNYSLFTPSLP